MNHIDASVMHEEMFRTIAEWKARAEEAEKTLHHEKTDNARYLARTWAERDAALVRAERAEALLREALGDLACDQPCSPLRCVCGFRSWSTKVRDLLKTLEK